MVTFNLIITILLWIIHIRENVFGIFIMHGNSSCEVSCPCVSFGAGYEEGSGHLTF